MAQDEATDSARAVVLIDPDDVDKCIVAIDEFLERGITPQITLPDHLQGSTVFGDHSDRAVAVAMNRIDKELWSRSIPRKHLDEALRIYSSRKHPRGLTGIKWPQIVYELPYNQLVALLPGLKRRVGERTIFVECNDGAILERLTKCDYLSPRTRAFTRRKHQFGALIDTEINLSTLAGIRELPDIIRTNMNGPFDNAGECQISLRAGPAAMERWNEVLSALSEVTASRCSVFLNIPFWNEHKAITALDWRRHVDGLRETCTRKGWTLTGGRTELESVGLQVGQQYPEVLSRLILSDIRNPSISVIVAIYNADVFIDQFFNSILSQECDEPFEIIFVDDGSCDSTWHKLQNLQSVGGVGVQLIRLLRKSQYKPGTFTFSTGAARQKGCEWARGDRFLFLDPDQLIDPRCVAEHLEMGRMGFDVVVGVRDNPEASTRDRVRSRIRHLGPLDPISDWWPIFFTGNASVSKDAFTEVGGFDEVLQYWGLDDRDLGYRLQLAGARCWHTPRARVSHIRGALSGGGLSRSARKRSCRFQMEVLYRKYLDDYILDAYKPFWGGLEESEPYASSQGDASFR